MIIALSIHLNLFNLKSSANFLFSSVYRALAATETSPKTLSPTFQPRLLAQTTNTTNPFLSTHVAPASSSSAMILALALAKPTLLENLFLPWL